MTDKHTHTRRQNISDKKHTQTQISRLAVTKEKTANEPLGLAS